MSDENKIVDLLAERQKRAGAPQYGAPIFSLDVYAPITPGGAVSGMLSGFDALDDLDQASARMRHQAAALEALALMLRDQAEQMSPTDDGHVMARAMIWENSRVSLWQSDRIETEPQADWLRQRFDDAKLLAGT